MSDLTDFITARLDEDEQVARAATPGPWLVNDVNDADWIYNAKHEPVIFGAPWPEASVFAATANAIHIARHDPARTLLRVGADRRILAEHQPGPADCPPPGGPAYGCETCHHDRHEGTWAFGDCETLKALASVWADHPDYRAEWKPEET